MLYLQQTLDKIILHNPLGYTKPYRAQSSMEANPIDSLTYSISTQQPFSYPILLCLMC